MKKPTAPSLGSWVCHSECCPCVFGDGIGRGPRPCISRGRLSLSISLRYCFQFEYVVTSVFMAPTYTLRYACTYQRGHTSRRSNEVRSGYRCFLIIFRAFSPGSGHLQGAPRLSKPTAAILWTSDRGRRTQAVDPVPPTKAPTWLSGCSLGVCDLSRNQQA